jgi:excisionase family DNA binding protein
MLNVNEDFVLTTQEACGYLRISRPTYLKYLYEGKIRGVKLGRGWKVLKSELDRFLKGDNGHLFAEGDTLFKGKALKVAPNRYEARYVEGLRG